MANSNRFAPGDGVQFGTHTDQWQEGDGWGEVETVGRRYVYVRTYNGADVKCLPSDIEHVQ